MREKLVNFVYSMATKPSRIRGLLTPFAMLLFFSAMIIVVTFLIGFKKDVFIWEFLPPLLKTLISLPLMTAGLCIMLWSNLHFFKAKGSPVPFNPPPRIVSTGPYVYVRNPMFLGMFIFIAGLGVLTESILLLFIFLPILITLVVWEIKTIEEPELEKRLGDDYIVYKQQTPLFFPKRKKKSQH